MGQFIFLDDDSRTVAVEDFPNRLLLRQDEASLRRCRIDGHDENNHVAAMNEVADDGSFGVSRLQSGQFFLQFMDAVTGQGADMNCMIIGLSRMLHQVGLIIDDKIRQALTPNEAQYFFISRSQAFRPIDDDDGNIGLIEDLLRPAYPFFSEGTDVVDPWRIDDDHRAQGQELHGLVNGVRRRPLGVRYDRQILAGNGVYDTRLTGIAATEKSDMSPFA